MESSTQILRRLLDERGVEWWNETDPKPQGVTMAHVDEQLIEYHENVNGSIGYHVYNMHDLTPAQAVEATLGRGTTTRHGKFRTKYGRSAPCCECCGYGIGDARWHYCPSCGAEVVDG